MKRRGFFTKLLVGAAVAPQTLKAGRIWIDESKDLPEGLGRGRAPLKDEGKFDREAHRKTVWIVERQNALLDDLVRTLNTLQAPPK